MAQVWADRVKESSTTTGAGAFTLGGAIVGFRAFSAVCANLDTVCYVISNREVLSEWEVGLGTWGTGGILTRTTVYASSNAGAAVVFSAGVKDVFLTYPAKAVVPANGLGGMVGQVLFPDGTTAAPSMAFASEPGLGLYRGATNVLNIGIASIAFHRFETNHVMGNSGALQWTLGDANATVDLSLSRDSANVLAQRNGVNAQTFHLYGTYTDAANFEALQFITTSGYAQIRQRSVGTGVARPLFITTLGASSILLGTNNLDRWEINSSGHLIAFADNTYDIGATAANRPKNIYAGTSVISRSFIADDISAVTAQPAPTIASAATIVPTKAITFISGVATISTITAPPPISLGGGQITLIPTGAWATNTAGNIALATTAVPNKALILTYDVTAAKWYPSY